IGGGIIMVPSIILFFGMNILDANAISLTAMLLPVGALGVIAYYKAGLIVLKDSLLIALGLFFGSFLGGELAVNISETFLTKLYVFILLYIAVLYLDIPSLIKKNKEIPPKQEKDPIKKAFWVYIALGIGAGIFAGLFGKGGGIVIVPILVAILHYSPKAAAATSLAALQLPVGLPSIIIYAQNGHLNIMYAVFIAIGIVLGTLWGTKLGLKLPATVFKKIFAFFLLAVAVYMMFK
ncbi:MAG: sulfite exporter TauE/SafE family protein, partial [Bacteroidales bacterium]|nr:sulfite exporter TauE/SafE family protein [Bacteroidales bacterium]